MNILAALLTLGLFCAAVVILRLYPATLAVVALCRKAQTLLTDPALGDDEKERLARRYSVRLLVQFARLTLLGTVAFSVPILLLLALDALDAVSFSAVVALLTRWEIVAGATAALAVMWLIKHAILRRPKPSAASAEESVAAQPQYRYSKPARALHRLAFATVEAQKSLADMEARVFARRLRAIEIDRPVFVTSLPRAGTTILLEALCSLPAFASHTYRDMPFLLVPMLWDAFSRPLHVSGAAFERLHGDGMTVCHDSPDAFDEIVWRTFWPRKYGRDRMALWSADDADVEVEPFIRMHFGKLRALRSSGSARYVSKNNANIARIPLLARLFPNAIILVPFRNPIDHAGSLLRTHLLFEKIHAGGDPDAPDDSFARRYMEYIGHFDFGANLRPINFGGWLDELGEPNELNELNELNEKAEPSSSVSFWLRYWCAAFEHMLAHADNVVLISYDDCCAHPDAALRRIARTIGVDANALAAQAGRFRNANAYDAAALAADPRLCARAEAIHAKLLARSTA